MADTPLARIHSQASLMSRVGWLVAAANGSSKIRSLACKTPAGKENPSNPLGNGMTLSSPQFHHPEVSYGHYDIVFAIDETSGMSRGLRDGGLKRHLFGPPWTSGCRWRTEPTAQRNAFCKFA